MRQISETILLALFTLICSSSHTGADSCGGITDMRLYVACLQNLGSLGCGYACDTNMIQCPPDTYSVGEHCVPVSRKICPNKAVYTNGTCQVFVQPTCPPNFTYRNGLCVGLDPACVRNYTDCTITTSDCQGSFGSCLHPTTCANGTVLLNGVCVLPNVAKCPESMTLENGICVRQKIPCEKAGNCSVPFCPTGSKLVNGTCVRISSCPEGSFQIGGVCAKCPLGSSYSNGECLSCPSYMIYENELCVCPGDTILFNNTCMKHPSPIEPETDEDDGDGDWLSATTKNTDITTTINTTSEKIISGNHPPRQHTYTHIFNVTDNIGFLDSDNEIDKNSNCCLILEPMQCEKSGHQYRCIKRRHHACGKDCIEVKVEKESEEFEESDEILKLYKLIEPRYLIDISDTKPTVHQQYSNFVLPRNIVSKQTITLIPQSVNRLSNQELIAEKTIMYLPEIATTTTKPAVRQKNYDSIPTTSFIHQQPVNENPSLSYDQIIVNYGQSKMIYNQPQQMEYQQPIQEQQFVYQQPIQEPQMIYQWPLQEQKTIYQQPLQKKKTTHNQHGKQTLYQNPIQEQQIIYPQPISEQRFQNYQQPVQEQQMIFRKSSQGQQMLFQQPLQEQQIIYQQTPQQQQMIYQQPMLEQQMAYGPQLQGQQMIYQQPMLEQQMVYGPQLQGQQMIYQQPTLEQQMVYGPQLQGQQMIYQQPMEGQQIIYQQHIMPTSCGPCT